MQIPVYASTGAFITRKNNRDYRLIAQIAPRLLADGIEFMMYDSWNDIALPMARELKATGVRFPAMHADKRIGEILSENGLPALGEAARMMARDIRMAEILGARTLVLHLWGGQASDSRFDEALDAYDTLSRMADAAGLCLAVENVICQSGPALARLKQMRERFPNARFTYDTKMAQLRGENELLPLPEWDWLFREGYVCHLHANDCNPAAQKNGHLAVLHYGDGLVDFRAFFRYARAAGFCGAATVESTSCREDGSVDTDKLNQSLVRVRAGLAREG